MKTAVLLAVPLSLTLTFLTGCNRAPVTSAESEPMATPQFSAKKGLLLPEQTRNSLCLKLVEVTERKLASSLALPLRVYQTDAARALAAGTATPEQARLLKVGQTVQVRMASGASTNGKLVRLSEELQKATGAVEVLVEIPAHPSMTIGAFVNANIAINSGASLVTVPAMALLACTEGYFVYTVSGEHLVRTAVKVGAKNDDFVEITDGLYAGDEVVLQPVLSLWMTELAAVKGGQACCVEPPKGK